MTQHFTNTHGRRLAYRLSAGEASKPGLVWLSGFNSDMQGGKVTALEAWAQANGYPFLAFDYSGHGESDGDFADGTVSAWREDSLSAIDELIEGPLILVGSSMGGWMALLSALTRPERVVGMVLLAPAPDFTQKLMWREFSEDVQQQIMEQGVYMRPSDYGEPYPITRNLIEDGKQWQILDDEIGIDVPVRILQGMQDPDVPWEHTQSLIEKLSSADVIFTLIKDGDHRLSRDQDVARLLRVVEDLGAFLQPE